MENQETLKLSVIVAADNASQSIEDCVEALRIQASSEAVEIIIVDCSTDGTNQIIKDKFPYVKLIHFPRQMSLPFLLGKGIACSSGEIIAITDATCVVDPNWVSEILKVHLSSHHVVGGAVEIEGINSIVDWAAYFCDYAQFMYPLAQGIVNELPGNNISFKRCALKKGQEFVQDEFWKTYWCQKLQKEGVQLISTPSIIVYYKKSFSLEPFLMRRFYHGRCFAGLRISGISIFMHVCYIVGSPLLVFMLLGRIIRIIASKKRHLKQFVLSFPIIAMAVIIWSFGEFWGYLTGPGNSCSQIHIH